MNTTTYVAATGALTIAGRWSQEKPLSIRLAVGLGFYAAALAMFNTQMPEVTQQLAVVVLLTTAFLYVPDIGKKTGLIGGK